TRRGVFDPDSAAEHPVEGRGNVGNRNLFRPFEVVNLVLGAGAHRQNVRAGQIVNVDIISILAPVALDHNRLALQGFAYEDRYDQLLAHAWTIRNSVTQDRE